MRPSFESLALSRSASCSNCIHSWVHGYM